MNIVLMGYMGSGKSSVGRLLAANLAYSYIDLDTLIESNENVDIASLFSNKGEIYFRKKENEILQEVLTKNTEIVLATGGGTPCYGTGLSLIKNTPDVISVYLQASVETLTERLFMETETRPLIAHLNKKEDLTDFIRKHLFERSYYYNQANIVVATDHKEITEIIEEIIAKLF